MITSGFFDSVDGDRTYSADDFSNYIGTLITDGVLANPSTALQVQETGDGMTVKVAPGWGYVRSHYIHNDADEYLTVDEADAALYRADRVIMRLDRTARTITLLVKKGTVSDKPNAVPALQRDENIWELSLAWIAIAPGTKELTQLHIIDEREVADACGLVTGIIDQIDTTNLFAQYDAAFSKWFASIQHKLENNWILVERVPQSYYDALSKSGGLDNHTLYLIDESVWLYPDIDGDNVITAGDAAVIADAAAKAGAGHETGLTPMQEALADVNHDGAITSEDEALVLAFLSALGAGQYDNTPEGWADFMNDQ